MGLMGWSSSRPGTPHLAPEHAPGAKSATVAPNSKKGIRRMPFCFFRNYLDLPLLDLPLCEFRPPFRIGAWFSGLP